MSTTCRTPLPRTAASPATACLGAPPAGRPQRVHQGLVLAMVARRLGVSGETPTAGPVPGKPVGSRRCARAARSAATASSPSPISTSSNTPLLGAVAHGFAGNLWTLDRITEVIWRLTGVRHHPVQVWRPSPSVAGACNAHAAGPPSATRPRSTTGWRSSGRGSKGARRRRAWVVFLDESGISLTPVVCRTWAPRGQPPVLVHPFHWQRAGCPPRSAPRSAGAARGSRRHPPRGSYNTERLIEVLGELHRFLDGDKVTLVRGQPGAQRHQPQDARLDGAPSGPGWSWNASRHTHRTSTRSRRCGPT